MYTKEEASRIRSEFWTSFGQYMAPVPSASGQAVNWVNYKTGIKHIRFTMDFNKRSAEAWIEFSFTDTDRRNFVFETFSKLFKESVQSDWWIFLPVTSKDERQVAAIKATLEGVNIFKKETWPEAITFLKERMIEADNFWADHKELIETLV